MAFAFPELVKVYKDRDAEWTDARREKVHELNEAASREHFGRYRPALWKAIKMAKPNLEALVCNDYASFDATFFDAATFNSIRHLKVERISLEDAYVLAPPLTPPTLPLTTLNDLVRVVHFLTELEFDDESNVTPAPPDPYISLFFASLRRCCASALEYLDWSTLHIFARTRSAKPPLLDGFQDPFPRLRALLLDRVCHTLALEALHSLLDAPVLHRLSPPNILSEGHEAEVAALAATHPLRELQDPVVPSISFKDNTDREAPLTLRQALQFLRSNYHIRKPVLEPVDDIIMNTHVVPFLASGIFTNLTSLYIAWKGPGSDGGLITIPAASLEAIRALRLFSSSVS